jgi:haloalkane dehalogenase
MGTLTPTPSSTTPRANTITLRPRGGSTWTALRCCCPILQQNFFVERLIPTGTATSLSDAVMAHYRGVQPSPETRAGVARFPKEILAARPLLERLSRDVSAKLGSKPALLVWGMKDVAFRPGPNIPRMRATFPDHVLVELPDAKHYIQEDAPDRISKAIIDRFD